MYRADTNDDNYGKCQKAAIIASSSSNCSIYDNSYQRRNNRQVLGQQNRSGHCHHHHHRQHHHYCNSHYYRHRSRLVGVTSDGLSAIGGTVPQRTNQQSAPIVVPASTVTGPVAAVTGSGNNTHCVISMPRPGAITTIGQQLGCDTAQPRCSFPTNSGLRTANRKVQRMVSTTERERGRIFDDPMPDINLVPP
uniref:Uncharacterized protein n=1 Tax=Anopheles culicifacies TaxID=139723 RepID=A0A182MLY3_9DIPT